MSSLSRGQNKLKHDFIKLLKERGYEINFLQHENDTYTITAKKDNYTYGDYGRNKYECLVKMLWWISGFKDEK